jgi:elongation factor Ts
MLPDILKISEKRNKLSTDISAKDVMQLRNMTGAGMMDCKEALKASNGNVDAAVDYLRKKGIAKATSKASRAANEGKVVSFITENRQRGSLVEINCETDFVAKTDDFQNFIKNIARQLAEKNSEGILDQQALSAFVMADGRTVKEHIGELVAKLGENITPNHAAIFVANEGFLTSYIHLGGKLGVLIEITTDGKPLQEIDVFAKDMAMQIAAARPLVVHRDEVPPAWIEKEKEIYREQALNEGKPENIVDRIADGKLKKYYSEICLLEQIFVKDTKTTVGDELAKLVKAISTPVAIKRFARLQVGQN